MGLQAGDRLGPYEVQALLGVGGMGEVYRGRDTRLGRDVALKLISPKRVEDASLRRRFELEARAASVLNHPSIVTVYDVGGGQMPFSCASSRASAICFAVSGAKGKLPRTLTHGPVVGRSTGAGRVITRDGLRSTRFEAGESLLTYIEPQCIRLLRMDLGKDLVAASATPLVLAILAEGESYGYAIIKRVTELSGGQLQWTDGMLYPVLHRLERHGYVAAKWGASENGRKRKYYRITRKGRAQLAAQRQRWQVVDDTLRGLWMRECTA